MQAYPFDMQQDFSNGFPTLLKLEQVLPHSVSLYSRCLCAVMHGMVLIIVGASQSSP